LGNQDGHPRDPLQTQGSGLNDTGRVSELSGRAREGRDKVSLANLKCEECGFELDMGMIAWGLGGKP
jgi:hypothetical protein